MNHVYRLLWNQTLNSWVAVAENVKGRGKSISARKLMAAALAVSGFIAPLALANPLNPIVANGAATFATTGNVLTVTNTPGTIINWQGFSIGANEITRFAQQSAASAVLNRVTGGVASSILGSLQSNGRVFLINPSGIVFGAGSSVDVAGLVASTLNLSNADFLAGNMHFTQVPGAANISNAGSITAQNAGQIFLIAPNVENTGVITAPNGEILLVAGHSVDLVSTSNPNLRVNITAPAGDATNVGQLIASSGSLGLFGTLVKNSGTVSADSAVLQGGKIVFRASQRSEIAGTVSANGTVGGTIQVLGNQVGVMAGAKVSANGTQGGGAVLIGGDYQGKNPDVPNAQFTYVAPTASISADATLNGKGGKVVVWADNATQFNGNISAQGGALSGDGGWVEVSGKQKLGYAGLVNTLAAKGRAGTLLLDPTDITVSTAATTPTLLLTGTGFADTSAAVSNLNTSTLQNQLALSNVIVDTTSGLAGVGNISVLDAVTWASANSLTLKATGLGAITVNAAGTMTSTGAGGLVLQTAGGGITLNGGVYLSGGAFSATASGASSDVMINAPVVGGAVNVTAGRVISGVGIITATSLALNAGTAIGSAIAPVNAVVSGNLSFTSGSGTFLNYVNSAAGYTYAGSWSVNQGPAWSPNPPVYSGQQAAALLFGGGAASYAISTTGVNPAAINFKTWLDGWGDSGTYGGTTPGNQSFSLDKGGAGYNSLPGTGSAYSAYISDHGVAGVNYAFRAISQGAVVAPAGAGTATINGTTVVLNMNPFAPPPAAPPPAQQVAAQQVAVQVVVAAAPPPDPAPPEKKVAQLALTPGAAPDAAPEAAPLPICQ